MKPLYEYTLSELRGLPIYGAGHDQYSVPANGEVTVVRDGVAYKLNGLRPGDIINVPRLEPLQVAMVHPQDPAWWLDSFGETWRPVYTAEGWKRRRL
jgi:hypothetical protein